MKLCLYYSNSSVYFRRYGHKEREATNLVSVAGFIAGNDKILNEIFSLFRDSICDFLSYSKLGVWCIYEYFDFLNNGFIFMYESHLNSGHGDNSRVK